MKKIVALILLVLVIQKWDSIRDFINPPPDYATEHGDVVILYATSWCGYCKKTRQLLVDNKIEYFEYDIEKSQKGFAQYKSLRGRGVPMLLINGEVVKGYNPAKILDLALK